MKRSFSSPRLYLLMLFLVGLLVATLSIWRTLQHQSIGITRVDQVSTRSQEFITKAQQQGATEWSGINSATTTPVAITAIGTPIETPCFTATTALRLVNTTATLTAGRCTFQAKSLDPIGQLVISSYPAHSYQEDPSWQLRHSQPEIFSPFALTHDQFPVATLFSGPDHSIIFAYQKPVMVTMAISNIAQPDPKIDDALKTMFASLKLTAASSSAATQP